MTMKKRERTVTSTMSMSMLVLLALTMMIHLGCDGLEVSSMPPTGSGVSVSVDWTTATAETKSIPTLQGSFVGSSA